MGFRELGGTMSIGSGELTIAFLNAENPSIRTVRFALSQTEFTRTSNPLFLKKQTTL
jgi:hypothetical protein